jgi:hypothetical protein
MFLFLKLHSKSGLFSLWASSYSDYANAAPIYTDEQLD